jgi:hypothetical protein
MDSRIKWSAWKKLIEAPTVGAARPFAQNNRDGRLEVFVRGGDGVFSIWQMTPNGAWAERWSDHGKPHRARILSHVVGRNADGRQEIFAVGDDGGLWQRAQTAPNVGWSDWQGRPGPPARRLVPDQLCVGRNQDERQEILAVADLGEVWQTWQTSPSNGWSDWKELGRPASGLRPTSNSSVVDRPSIARNQDGRQELFAMGADDALWHVWQVAPNVGWSKWDTLRRPRDPLNGSEGAKERDLNQPVVGRNADGHLEVFAPGNGAFCNRWQEEWRRGPDAVVWRKGGWHDKPRPSPSAGLVWLEVALNFTGHMEVIGLADDGALWHAWQVDSPPFWSAWESLGAPQPSGIRLADRLTVGTNQDGRLEVFVVGGDGAMWQIWQTR